MLSPFWIMTMTVWLGVIAGEMRETSDGGISAQFFVVVTM